MAIEPQHPEIPYPLPPERMPPKRTEPIVVPMVTYGGSDPWEQLSEQRRILVSGPLNREAITELSAKLMAFDGESSRDVEIVINSGGGPLTEIFPVLDVLALMRARTNTTCIGTAAGTAVAILASGTGTRRAAPNATVCLRIDDRQAIDGSTTDIVRQAAELDALRARYVTAVAAATGRERGRIVEEIDRGRFLTATEAREAGIVDEVGEAANPARR